ncbi:MAG: hypothetical protein JWQ30_1034 [Sediminibacterium sp.]|nr:hypothetical protein [Sediminibacterium sp.]
MQKFTFSEILMGIIVLMIFAFFFTITLMPQVAQNNNIGEIKTALISTLTAIIGYQYGSSKSSARKDETINSALTDKKPVVNNANTVNVD